MRITFLIIFITAFFTSCNSIKVTEVEKNYILNDKGKDKYYLIELIKNKQKEKTLGEMPMLIVNGDPKFHYFGKSNKPANISKKDIKSIKIVEAEKCVNTFGAACKYGLITINTYGKQEILP